MQVGSDLLGIWGGLERGRLEWLKSVSFCHKLKTTLKAQITKDGFEGADAKMVWLYSMATMLPSCNQVAKITGGAKPGQESRCMGCCASH